ncbi:hypothetical protein JKP88DRAFT_315678 [Tribonema minus]|uniref:Uncharacterized protein n=1 Tax=Tribonema minus TaxID=303371 RepID=A0A835Z0B2_9STRA|nr:hypothetical protein JKP88DRAFT_315678 [Tribonema minus]
MSIEDFGPIEKLRRRHQVLVSNETAKEVMIMIAYEQVDIYTIKYQLALAGNMTGGRVSVGGGNKVYAKAVRGFVSVQSKTQQNLYLPSNRDGAWYTLGFVESSPSNDESLPPEVRVAVPMVNLFTPVCQQLKIRNQHLPSPAAYFNTKAFFEAVDAVLAGALAEDQKAALKADLKRDVPSASTVKPKKSKQVSSKEATTPAETA